MQDKLGDKARLLHILKSVEEIENYTHNVDLNEFVSNSMMFNATLRQLEIIGEASNRLSTELMQNNQDVPWARMIGLRNLVIHEYFGVDDFTIWSIITINLPEIKPKIKLIVDRMS